MKRFLTLIFAFLLILSAVSCSGIAYPESEREGVFNTDIPESSEPIAEKAIGVTQEGRRMVKRYSESFAREMCPDGVAAAYQVYEFSEYGVLINSELWYVFDNYETYEKSLTEYIETFSDYFLRQYNNTGLYYSFYIYATIWDMDDNEVLMWDEFLYDQEHNDGDKYILVR